MSVFEEREIPCPHCGHRAMLSVAASLHAPRVPEVRAAIFDGSFQRFPCGSCGEPFVVEGPFIYIDFDAKQWFGVYPRKWEAKWRTVEDEALGSFQRNMQTYAPPMVKEMAEGFAVRAVFGIEALAEKLRCFDAGIDDAALEVLKLDLMRSQPELHLSPEERPSLCGVADDKLLFAVPGGGTMSVPRELLDGIAADRDAWSAGFEGVSGGPYVDAGRVLIGG